MFQPQFALPAALALVLASAPIAFAQNATASLSGSVTYRAHSAAPLTETNSDAILAALSAQAGIPYIPRKAKPAPLTVAAEPAESRLCLRAGLGLTVPVMAGPQMTVEHGLIGCPTNTGGLPIVVLQDPALQPPPTSRTGDYNVDLTLRYRLLQLKRIQLVASATEQGVGYSLNSPVSGNNLLLAMSLIF